MSLSAKPSGKPLVPAPSTPVCSLILSSETNRLESSSPFRPLPLSPGPATQPPPALSPQPWHCAAAHILLRSPTCCAARFARFRATATAARFFAFFPPRSHSRNPYRRKSVSGPNGPKIYCALPTSSLRTIVSPALRWAVSDDRAYRDLTILSWCKRPVYAN